MDLHHLPYGILVPVAIQLVKFGIELRRHRRSTAPSRITIPSLPRLEEPIVAKYLVLCTDGSQRWRLPDDVDISQLRATIRGAMQDRRVISVKVLSDDVESELDVDGAKLTAFSVVPMRDPSRNVVRL